MTEQEFQLILIQIRDDMLAEMQKHYKSKLGYNPTTWDINNGSCNEFQQRVEEFIPEVDSLEIEEVCYENEEIKRLARIFKRSEWFYVKEKDTFLLLWEGSITFAIDTNIIMPSHCILRFKDKYYDAECIKGVRDWRNLPIIKNANKTRSQVLAERKRKADYSDC